MFPSGRPKWNSVEVGPRRDIVDIISNSLKRYGIKFGIYYSLSEGCNKLFLTDIENENSTMYTDTIVFADIKFLVTKYKPALLWPEGYLDLSCKKSPNCSYWKAPELLSWLYNDSPVKEQIVVNDRWCRETHGRHGDFYKFNLSKFNLIILILNFV